MGDSQINFFAFTAKYPILLIFLAKCFILSVCLKSIKRAWVVDQDLLAKIFVWGPFGKLLHQSTIVRHLALKHGMRLIGPPKNTVFIRID